MTDSKGVEHALEIEFPSVLSTCLKLALAECVKYQPERCLVCPVISDVKDLFMVDYSFSYTNEDICYGSLITSFLVEAYPESVYPTV